MLLFVCFVMCCILVLLLLWYTKVREAAVDLVGQYILSNPALALAYHDVVRNVFKACVVCVGVPVHLYFVHRYPIAVLYDTILSCSHILLHCVRTIWCELPMPLPCR
jgi:hypothetical protein